MKTKKYPFHTKDSPLKRVHKFLGNRWFYVITLTWFVVMLLGASVRG